MTGWRAGLVVLALGAAIAGGAPAQTIPIGPPGTTDRATPPGDAPATVPPGGRGPEDDNGRQAGQVLATAAPDADGTLLPFRPVRPGLSAPDRPRLIGEAAQAAFTLPLPAVPRDAILRIAHRSGIDMLPDASEITVTVNGTPVGTVQPGNFDGFETTRLPLPDGLLHVGMNTVTLRARHGHRIACGPEASFALWTEIDIAQSGIALEAGMLAPNPLGFLAAASAQMARGDPLVIRRPDPGASLLDAAPFIARIGAALGGAPPAIRSEPYWTDAGTTPALARITALPAGSGLGAPRFARGGDGAIVLLVEQGADYGAVTEQLLEEAGLAGAAGQAGDIPALTPGTAQPLGTLDAPVLSGEGRYALVPVRFRLPGDWLLLASQKARLDLEYGFAAGLPDGALMLVKVNDTTVRLLPLDIAGGDSLPTLPIRFAASLLQPGVNRLDFEILVPGDPPNAACPRLEGPIVEIRPTSRLTVPKAPGMRMPSLVHALDTLPAQAMTLSAQAAQTLPPGFMPQIAAALWPGSARIPGEARLTVGTTADLARIPGAVLHGGTQALLAALRSTPGGAEDTAPTAPEDDRTQPRSAVWSALAGLPDRLHALVFGAAPDLAGWLEGRTATAALIQPDLGAPGAVWLIMAPGADPDAVARALAAARHSAQGPRGQIALLEGDGRWHSWAAPGRPIALSATPRLADLRAIMGNYASHAPLRFTSLFLALAAASALIAILLLLVTRREGRR